VTNVLSVSVTEKGRALAARLPYPAAHGEIGATVTGRWNDVDGLVLFVASGAAVRIIAPLLEDKATDPAVVCVDEAGRFAVSLCGGHAREANQLAVRVAGLLGARAVVTTATDAAGITALDQLPTMVATGDIAGVTTAMLDGRSPAVVNQMNWPLPPGLVTATGLSSGTGSIVVTDLVVAAAAGLVTLHPPSLVVGVGASTGAPAEEVRALVASALADAGLARASVAEVATIDLRATDPAILALDLPVRAFGAAALNTVPVPTPSAVVAAAVGTASVAEAAALLAAGSGADLVVTKLASAHATVAVARRRRPRGRLAIVGLGPGHARHRTPAAEVAVRQAEVVIGYGPYVDQCTDLLDAHAEVVRSPIGDEVVRAKQALAEADAGRRVALVSSGDPGVYAMAGIALELAADSAADVEIEVVPGVPAALAAAALLGAPLAHDHVVISLSDLLTPWPVIAARLEAAAGADLVVVLYNPRSRGRSWQLEAARTILAAHRAPDTPVGVVTDAARPGQQVVSTTLADLDVESVGMTTCVVIGSSTTAMVNRRMVTPRGYHQ